MATYRIKQAAELLGVSDDTVRRWADSGRLSTTTEGSRQVVDGAELARLAQELAESGEHHEPGPGRLRPRRATGSSAWSPGSCATP